MLKMDGCTVVPGDYVFDVTRGRGRVADVRHDGLDVEFQAGGLRTYNKNFGTHAAPLRQLFWHNPVAYTPPKDVCTDRAIRCAINALASTVRCA